MRINTVDCKGFKGTYKYPIYFDRVVVNGKHRSGKSRCREAIQYVLSGKIPGCGKRNDDLRAYFGVDGGYVQIDFDDGSWIRRTLKIDHEKVTASEKLECSEEGPDGKPDFSKFRASDVVLNLGELIGEGATIKSAEKKREWVLKLLGSGEKSQGVIQCVAEAYAKELNPMATERHLALDEDLPEDVKPLAREWRKDRGVMEILKAQRKPDQSTTEVLLKFSDKAKEMKNSAQAVARESKAAIDELERGLEGAEAVAEELEERREAAKEATQKYADANWLINARDANKLNVDNKRQALADLNESIEKAESELLKLPVLGEEPTRVDNDKELQSAEDGLSRLQERKDELKRRLANVKGHQDKLENFKNEMLKLNERAKYIYFQPWAEALRIVEDNKDGIPPRLVELLTELSSEHNKAVDSLREERRSAETAIDNIEALISHCDPIDSIQANLTRSEESYELQRIKVDKLRAESREAQRSFDKELAEWHEWNRKQAELKERIATLKNQYEAGLRDLACASGKFEEVNKKIEVLGFDVEMADQSLKFTRERLQSAEEAAGEVKAYKAAVERCNAAQVSCEAWKTAIKAIAKVREELVISAAKPLVDAANEMLAAAGRVERIYLRLENARGKPAWELGWVADGRRRPIEALSGAETVLVSTALAVAIAQNSDGRRILMIEAAEIHGDLPSLLAMLTAASDIENIIVLTAADITPPDGWAVIALGEEVKAQAVGA